MIKNERNSTTFWFRLTIIFAVLFSVPFVFRAAGSALGNRDNQVRQWLPRGFEETDRYDWFVQHFGSDEFALVSWNGATLSDERIPRLAEVLRRHSRGARGSQRIRPYVDAITYFDEIVTGPELVARLEHGDLQLDRRVALGRLRGSLVGPDGETTGLVVVLSERGQLDRHAAVNTILESAARVGVLGNELRLGGPTIDSVALDNESERSRYRLAILSLFLGSIAAWRCLGQWKLVTIVLLTAIYCAAASLAWVSLIGDKLNLVMVTMPTLVYVLTISGAIHVTHYCKFAQLDPQNDMMRMCWKAAWLPCSLTAATTAVGLGSLVVSNVTPVRLFGFYSAIGVLYSLPIILLFLPATLTFLLPGRGHDFKRESITSVTGRSSRGISDRTWQIVMGNHFALSVGGAALMLTAGVGLTRMSTSVKSTNFFSPQSRVIADYRWLEDNLGGLVPLELVVRMPQDDSPQNERSAADATRETSTGTRLADRLRLVAEIQKSLLQMEEVESAISAATFAPSVPWGGGMRQTMRRAAIERNLRQNREQFLDSAYIASEGQHQLWRISARVNALNDLDYGLFLDELRTVVDPIAARFAENRPSEIDVVYTGVVPLIYKAQRVLLNDLVSSFLLAFGIIGVVMCFMMRGLTTGLVSMIPNLFPAVVVFGTLGWLGIVCDIGTVITASVALGIAVDDTVHFLTWFQRGLQRGMSRRAAVRESFRRCGTAMLQTTTICGLGMLGFAFSEFAPTARFSILMSVLLIAALVGDLLFLPALLLSPLGRVFETRRALAAPSRVMRPRSARPARYPVAVHPARASQADSLRSTAWSKRRRQTAAAGTS